MRSITTFGTVRLYWETLRHLQPRQVVGRIARSLPRPRPRPGQVPPLRIPEGKWVKPASRRPSLLGAERLRLLNEEHDLTAIGWDDARLEKLWRYNLHYFDDLNALNATDRLEWQRSLIERWITENPIGSGSGWEPYPTSLRIVNWVKWAISGADVSPTAVESLAIQARWLSRRLEYHLLGNHLFANAKALLFAGLFFDGNEAGQWVELALRLLAEQVPEQILSDGGHFERSTMYHALALEDLLDLINVATVYSTVDQVASAAQSWRGCLPSMLGWQAAMCHPDGEIAFFNDSAIGIAPSPAELRQYASRLAIPAPQGGADVVHLAASGYIRIERNGIVALLDVAPVGPDYLPGHAHADTLSFELSVHGQRVLVNSGTSVYGSSSERLRQRGTAAHNTVLISKQDSSEIWSGFRVARRARPFDLRIESDSKVLVACSHDGYRRLSGGPIHRRVWRVDERWMEVRDTIEPGGHMAEARYHLHPSLCLTLAQDGAHAQVMKDGKPIGSVATTGGRLRIENTTYHPEFGVTQPNKCLVVAFDENQTRFRFEVS